MKLSKILKYCDFEKIIGPKNIEVSGICYHSKKTKPNFMFCAIKGQNTDGHFFIDEAISEGAKTIICEKPFSQIENVAQIIVKDSKIALSQASQAFYNFPNKSLKIIGVTGTNGKTSTTFLIKAILDTAGLASGLIGTIYYQAEKEILKQAERTTPMSLDLIQIFDEFLKRNLKYSVMEVSSHSLDLKRVYGLGFKIAVFLGISREHLDYHKNLKSYLKTKLKIVNENKSDFVLVNIDNPFGKNFLSKVPKNTKKLTFGKNPKADILAKDIKTSFEGTSFKICYKNKIIPINLKLIGDFQVYNGLAAFGVGVLLRIPLKIIKTGFEKIKVIPGRFEVVKAKDFKIIIDYAHTPEALKKLLLNCKKLPHQKLILVFGCGGTRDKTKRIPMGEIAGNLADFTIITSDNPRFEKPESIINQIEKGIKKTKGNYLKIVDRKKAIEKAIKFAKKDDLVVIAGKGHETSQTFKDRTIPFSDKKVAKNLLARIYRGRTSADSLK